MRHTAKANDYANTEHVIDNETLVKRVQDGNFLAVEILYRRFSPKIAGILAKLLRNCADADDAMQETFIEAVRDIADLKDPQYLERWLLRIAVHRAHHQFRKRRLRRLFGLDRSIDDEPLSAQAAVAASQEIRVELGMLDAAFDAMSHKERTCFVLRHIEGYRLDEVAEAVGISTATVKRRILKARSIINRHFSEAKHD